MGFLDKVKERTAGAIEQGKEAAQTQQAKLQLKRLQGEEDDALAAFGNAAYTLWESGSLSMSSDLGAAAQRIKDARAAITAKRDELAGDGSDGDGGTDASPVGTAGSAATGTTPDPLV